MFKVHKYVAILDADDINVFRSGDSDTWESDGKEFETQEEALNFALKLKLDADKWFASDKASYASSMQTLSGDYSCVYYPVVDMNERTVDLSIMSGQDASGSFEMNDDWYDDSDADYDDTIYDDEDDDDEYWSEDAPGLTVIGDRVRDNIEMIYGEDYPVCFDLLDGTEDEQSLIKLQSSLEKLLNGRDKETAGSSDVVRTHEAKGPISKMTRSSDRLAQAQWFLGTGGGDEMNQKEPEL